MLPANLQIKHQAQTAGGQLVDVGRLDRFHASQAPLCKRGQEACIEKE